MNIETSERFEDFVILKSSEDIEGNLIIPSDISICKACVEEIFDRCNRRHLYPFTACTDCGVRFTTIETLPYDRENTTMKDFLKCSACECEYLDIEDRRFRAEQICCPACGPRYDFYMGEEKLEVSNPIKEAVSAIEDGKIVAVKGVGGTHFVTNTQDEPILKIREILHRKYKPFAIMAKDIDSATKIAHISWKERENC